MARHTAEVISTIGAPAAIGPYSQAIKIHGVVYTAGQIPLDPETMSVVEGGIEAQAERVMQNLAAILAASGSSLDRAVKTTCFLANLDDFPAFNAVYARYFATNPPARSTVEVSRLPMGVLVEVDCVALAD
ncbi:MAG: RidA family protein [Thermomicrobiales bacterium]